MLTSAKVLGSKLLFLPPPVEISRDPKRPILHRPVGKVASYMMKRCSQILAKPHWVFNKPADVVALGLHDYRQLIKYLMDLRNCEIQDEKEWSLISGRFCSQRVAGI